jgi:hypothetical protein
MLHGRTLLARAALALALALWALPAAADHTIGSACSVAAGDSARMADANNEYCNGSTWQYPSYQFGVAEPSSSCGSGNAGQVQWTGSILEACNGASWIPIDSGMHFIATQTASSSANLQFTNLPTSYNTLVLNCSGLIMSNSTTSPQIIIGEGAGPTWETGAHYTDVEVVEWNGGGLNPTYTTTGTDIINMTGSGWSTTTPFSIKAYIDNVGSSTLYKNVTFQYIFNTSNESWGYNTGGGYWNNDKNAVTGLSVTTTGVTSGDTGTFTSGTCSLYGMN